MKNDQKLILNNFNDNDAYNDYYASVSVLFRIASFVFLIAFLLFIVYSAFGSQEAFNYDNFEYIVRNFALTLDEKRNDASYSIRYNPDSSRSFALIGNKLALCGNSGISIYSSTGRLICSDSFSFKNPVMLSSDKYALIYDSGSHDYVLYNTFTMVHSRSTDKPIRGACMANNGSFALITSSDEYNSTVEIYNDNFKLVNRFNKSGYVIDVDIVNDIILIATVDKSGAYGLYDSKIHLYDMAKGETLSEINLESSLPLSCNITSTGFILVCSNETIIYDTLENVSNVHSYNGASLFNFDYSYDTVALLLDPPGHDISYQLLVINSDSDVLYDYMIESTVYDVIISRDICYVTTAEQILVLDSASVKKLEISGLGNDCELLLRNEDSLYLCTGTSAYIINIKQKTS